MTEAAIDILLVEDNPSDEELALHALRKFGLTDRVRVARDGEEALDYLLGRGEFARRSPHPLPRLILLDLKLPKVDGLEVLRQVKQNPSTRDIPVVLLTSSAEPKDVARGYTHGANSFIVKPVEFGEFLECVKTLGMYWLVMNRTGEAGGEPSDPSA